MSNSTVECWLVFANRRVCVFGQQFGDICISNSILPILDIWSNLWERCGYLLSEYIRVCLTRLYRISPTQDRIAGWCWSNLMNGKTVTLCGLSWLGLKFYISQNIKGSGNFLIEELFFDSLSQNSSANSCHWGIYEKCFFWNLNLNCCKCWTSS